jgi:O-Glycosyl hydrolase
MRNWVLFLALLTAFSCQRAAKVEWVSTTFDNPWQVMEAVEADASAEASVVVDLSAVNQAVEGFGTCFNELGWASLSELSETDRAAILEDLFTSAGMNLTMARMPVGANDFSVDFYSYDDVPGDLALEHFSIDRDRQRLIPFIRAAKAVNPSLRIWASPWCPPTWMKVSGHYASRTAPFNGLPKNRETPEGTDAFILEPAYLQAYAQYFGKFIDAYKAEGIDIFMVMPQNEPNSDQVFPSCTWTPEGLISFLKYLVPEMAARDVDVFLGTMERADPEMWDRILTDSEVGPSIKGMGFQWAGKDALPELHRRHPALPCYQTEQECGDGRNDWRGAMHSWDLMKHYFGNGVQSYFYWNTSLLDGGISTWMWRQNSLVVVDKEKGTYRYSPEYYVLKHASHYVQPGARVLTLGGTFSDALGFLNHDGRIVLLLANQGDAPKTVSIDGLQGRARTLTLPAGSINTLVL